MSVLAGSDWDEDGIKASPGVAGVCRKTEIEHTDVTPAAASAAHALLLHHLLLKKHRFGRKKEEEKRIERCRRKEAIEVSELAGDRK